MAKDWLAGLNEAQRQAATAGDGPLLVVAGAGTGKTNTLACRVAHLSDRGVPADRVLLLTFTRRAAREMLSRAGRYVGDKVAAGVWGGTFHATANRLLRIYGQAVGLAPEFTILDQSDSGDLMGMVRNELGFAGKERRFANKDTLVKIHSRTVNACEKLGVTLTRYFPWCRDDQDDIRAIFEAYTQRKRTSHAVDYDDLLLYWRALCETPQVGETVADRFDHILVDEYQDTNAIQADILAAMRRRVTNLMVVGDDAQAIYSFRAATIRNILDFPQRFPGAQVVALEQNYRSTTPILDASNCVMSAARERHTKELWSTRVSQRKPELVHCADEADQCNTVCTSILENLESGAPLMRQAVLFRAGHHSDQLEVDLSRRNIPFRKYGGLKFIETAHIKDMVALLRILENPYDELSWFRILLLIEGIGPKTARRIVHGLFGRGTDSENGNGSADAAATTPLARLLGETIEALNAATEKLAELRTALAECCGIDLNKPGRRYTEAIALVSQVERLRRLYEPLCESKYHNADSRMRDVEQLEVIAAGYRSRSAFLTDITLDPPDTASDWAGPPHLDEDYLTLSTIHSAKGCEWDVVHVIHAADGMIPSDMALQDEAGLEEERRLLYVAMTRARDVLRIYFPVRYHFRKNARSDAHTFAKVSRFLTGDVQALFDQRSTMRDAIVDNANAAAAQQGRETLDAWLRSLWSE